MTYEEIKKKAEEMVNEYHKICNISMAGASSIFRSIAKQCAIKCCEDMKRENESMLEMAKLHMDERACLVLGCRIVDIEDMIESIKQIK